jgi:hypothetical protein
MLASEATGRAGSTGTAGGVILSRRLIGGQAMKASSDE